jgi:cytochrome c oxidase assembly protein subunit 15
MIGLGLGVGFTLALMYFMKKGYFLGRMKRRLLGLLAVGAMQGGVGWWMVKSGLE